ncbi:MAG: protein kinase [Proteobacteria bacterium]|nr:protein kinase [Pseudomonadota bacterium]
MNQGDAFKSEAGPIPLGITLDDTYHVRRLLGRGSMGLVYLGEDIRLERPVAIKVLSPRYSADARVAQRFRREAVAMASVRAENVVQIFASGDYRGHPYFAMEYVPGYTVGSLIEAANQREEQLYLDVVLGILRQACRGLQAVHDRGIVHRDIKPPNMLIGPSFRVAIADFGLVETVAQPNDVRDLAGTPLYLAPELIRRDAVPEHQLHLADLYALSVSTYEMLTGEPPFDAPTVGEILQLHLRGKPPSVTEIRSDIPRTMADVVARAMSKAPADRFVSCHEFMQALDGARQHEASARPRSAPVRVLVAEDDPEMRAIYSTALQVGFPGVTVLTADDGLAALNLARQSRPDLALVDLNMPNLNGVELAAALRGDERTASIPLIVLTAHLDVDSRRVLQHLGIARLVPKPIDVTELLAVVGEHLQRIRV